MKHTTLLTAMLAALPLLLPTFASADDGRLLFDFADETAGEQWRPVNDGVMGGRSDGRFEITEDGTMRFFGNLSLENNGGFASVRSRPAELELDADDQIVARIRGDGRDYLLNLYVATSRIAFSYRASLETEKDEWIEASVPLADFEATSFGRPIRDAAPVDADEVNAVGFMLSDGQAGPFTLEIDSIRAVKSNDAEAP